MILEWKSFQIDLNSFNDMLKSNISAADGIVTNGEGFEIVESSPFTQEEIDYIQGYYDNLTEIGELAKITPALQLTVKVTILAAMDFGRNLIAEYGVSNVLDGLSIEEIQDIIIRTTKVQTALASGSLYVALAELALVETDETILTSDKITVFRNKIQSYLNIPLT